MSTKYLETTSSCVWFPHKKAANFQKQCLREVRWKFSFLMTWPWKSHCITFASQDSTHMQRGNKDFTSWWGQVSKSHCQKIMGDGRDFANIFGKCNWPHTLVTNFFEDLGKWEHSGPRIPWGIDSRTPPYQNLGMLNPLYKMAQDLHITYTHPLVHFKSFLDFL